MAGRILLLSVFALAFVLALWLTRYLNRSLADRRPRRWLVNGLFFAQILALIMPTAVIVANPSATFGTREQLLPYAYVFYIGAAAAVVLLALLAGIAGAVALKRGDLKRFLIRFFGFVRCGVQALRRKGIFHADRRKQMQGSSYFDYTLLYNASTKGKFGSLTPPTSSGHLNDPRNHLSQDHDLLAGRNDISADYSDS